ncbi:MAG: hypothetical protein WCF99_16485 [Chloroflexales bacterium]
MSTYDPNEAARNAREAQSFRSTNPPPPPAPARVKDPLPYCIYTTVCLIAWVVSPALAITFFAGLALRKYWRAWRAGLSTSDCLLGDPRRVMAYLATLMLAGAGYTIYAIWHMMV